MGIDELKRWHWMIIGLLLGAMFGGSRVYFREPDMSGPRSYRRDQFEEVLWNRVDIRNLVLHPPMNGQEWVTGELYRLDRPNNGPRLAPQRRNSTQPAVERPGKWVQFPLLASDVELTAKDTAAIESAKRAKITLRETPAYGTYPTAREYLAQLAVDVPGGKEKLAFKYAWWETSRAMLTIYTSAGFVVIGVIWPTIINLMIGAGLGRPKKEADAYDLSRFKSGSKAAPVAKQASAADTRLAELNAKLEADVAGMIMGSNLSTIEQEDEEEAQAIRQLETQRLEVEAKERAIAESKEYKGEFYPVAKPGGKKPGEH